MMKNIAIVFLCLGVFCFLPGVRQAEAKEKPVEGVWGIFDEFGKFEAQFRHGNWSEAKELLTTIDNDYKKLVGSLKSTVDANTLQKFGFLLPSMQKKVEAKNAEELEKPYALIQGLFLDIMNFYDYPNPPVLILTARYLGYAKEGLAKDSLKDVAEEMGEILSFKPRLLAAFKEKGLADPEGFIAKVESTQKAAKEKEKGSVAKQLTELADVVAPYQAK